MSTDIDYEVIIGLEVHIQVRTATKMFCPCPNASLEAPNTRICPICMGYPGVLPVPNKKAIRKTILAGMMLGCEIPSYSKFDRKSYFYPDMPKNYQISQYDLPLCVGGGLEIAGKGLSGDMVAPKTIQLTRIHLEEDVAKSTHFGRSSGIDFNRAGVPLMEVVSEPDIRSADEAYVYLSALKQVMQYAGISDCDMEKGQMRCDVNISIRERGSEGFNPKAELKNLNSFKNVHHAIDFEIDRQIELMESGGTQPQETRGWNADRGESYSLRSKESAHDYRYFPEPDLMPLTINDELRAEIREKMPETPQARRARFEDEYEIPSYDAAVLTAERPVADYYETCVKAGAHPKKASNWIMVELLRELSDAAMDIGDCRIGPTQLASLLALIDKGTINGKIAKDVFHDMFESGKNPDVIVDEKGLVQVTDDSAIREFVDQAIADNPGPVEQYREGKAQALNFLVGQVMKFSRGKANPQMAREALQKAIDG